MRAYLDPGERIQLEARPHGIALVVPLVRAIVLGGAGAGLVVLGSPVAWPLGALGVAALALGAALALADVWRWDRTQLVLTTDKLFVVYGIARRRAAAVRLARVGTVEVEQGVIGRLLGYGTIVAGDLEIPYVPRPAEVCRLLR